MSEKKAIHKFKAGDVFDERYILEKLMGSGGFADVWKAKDKRYKFIHRIKDIY